MIRVYIPIKENAVLRFRNPGTQFETQLLAFRQVYSALGEQAIFGLEDIANALATNGLMTAYGYAGNDALQLSKTKQESKNSTLMNAKMYAEVFRMLGWITPAKENSSYPLAFTYIGAHIALSDGDCSKLYEQCVIGINNPTEFSGKMHYEEKTRFFTSALKSLVSLDGVMYKHELCLGPMSVDDQDKAKYETMLKRIKNLRGNYQRLKAAFEKLADSLGMKMTPVDNCTRLPIALMKHCNWVQKVTNSTLYNKPMVCLQITKHGKEIVKQTSQMKDLRLDEFQKYDKKKQYALIRLGIYSMLERAGYDMSEVSTVIAQDKKLCADILKGQELLFSPYQTIRRSIIEEALGIHFGTAQVSAVNNNNTNTKTQPQPSNQIHIFSPANYSSTQKGAADNEETALRNEILKLHNNGYFSEAIVKYLMEKHEDATQKEFYPLIATIFRILGFSCSYSRPGDNGARWDAIIDHSECSIPIEIKSPTEERHISIKAVRQALENKIILLSRRTHITQPSTSSLAVGYLLPNERAEVDSLIDAIHKTYGYNIGVFGFSTLLNLAVTCVTQNKTLKFAALSSVKGVINENI